MNAPWTDDLTRALLDFNGKRAEALEGFAANCRLDAALTAALCDFAASEDTNTQAASTWLLKRFGVTGADLSSEQTEGLLRLLLAESHWLARLHVLQLMESLDLRASPAADLMAALEALAGGDNTFIRAWSVHGAAALADQQPAYRERVLDLLARAGQDAAPSVRARRRKTSRAFDWI